MFYEYIPKGRVAWAWRSFDVAIAGVIFDRWPERQPSADEVPRVGNPFGAHPDHFFPSDFGRDFTISPTLKPLEWLKDRMTVVSHTDHNMVSGHGREISFLSACYQPKLRRSPKRTCRSISFSRGMLAVRFGFHQSVHHWVPEFRMSWTANGVARLPIDDPQKLFDHLFLNLTPAEKKAREKMLSRNESILDAVGGQFSSVTSKASQSDRDRIEQFQTSVRELEQTIGDRKTWLGKDKPAFDISEHFVGQETIANRYNAIFDMISYAFETDLTRVASVEFPSELKYTDLEGVNRSYHGCTHNGKKEDITAELVAIETFQISCLSRCLKRLDAIKEPNSSGSMLDHTIVLFGSGMGYGGTHSNRNLPILVAGGGFQHRGHVDARDNSGNNMPAMQSLCLTHSAVWN